MDEFLKCSRHAYLEKTTCNGQACADHFNSFAIRAGSLQRKVMYAQFS